MRGISQYFEKVSHYNLQNHIFSQLWRKRASIGTCEAHGGIKIANVKNFYFISHTFLDGFSKDNTLSIIMLLLRHALTTTCQPVAFFSESHKDEISHQYWPSVTIT